MTNLRYGEDAADTTVTAGGRKKVLLVLSQDIYIRNYLRSGALEDLAAEHDVSIVASDRIQLKKELLDHPAFLGFFSSIEKQEKLYQTLFKCLMWRHRKNSKTFFYRWLRLIQWGDVNFREGIGKFIKSFSRWVYFSARNPRDICVPLVANRLIFPITEFVTSRRIIPNGELEKYIGRSWDLVAFPSAAFESIASDIPIICNRVGIPSIALIDNWDNLTSKTVFWAKPDFLGVWGAQAKRQAIEIHGFEASCVLEIGTPRFGSYIEARNKDYPNLYGKPYILFVGAAMPFDELGALHRIESELENLGMGPDEIAVVYRPHPWQQRRKVGSTFHRHAFRFSILDHQMEKAPGSGLAKEKDQSSFQPDLDYYPGLLRNASFVVGPLTTMLLEAAICLRPVLALSHSDGFHFSTSRRYFSHFDGLERLPAFVFCDEQDDLGAGIQTILSLPHPDEVIYDQVIGEYLFSPPKKYGAFLASEISSICDSRSAVLFGKMA